MSVAMALAESSHPPPPVGQNMLRAGGWVRDAPRGVVPEQPTLQEPGTQNYGLGDDDSVPELSGARPTPLVEVRPQEWVQRLTVELIVDVSPFVQSLDVPVPRVANQLVEFMKLFDTQSPVEQVIAAPKISQDMIPRFVDRRRPQRAEQLVEVPTVVSHSSLQQSAEHNVDIPVPGTPGDHGGLQGFHPRQGSLSRTAEHIVDIPVGGDPADFLPDHGFAAPSAVSRGWGIGEKCEGRRAGECGAG